MRQNSTLVAAVVASAVVASAVVASAVSASAAGVAGAGAWTELSDLLVVDGASSALGEAEQADAPLGSLRLCSISALLHRNGIERVEHADWTALCASLGESL